jgi:hypothetical protein
MQFAVQVTKIRVLNDHEDDDSGQLNFVLTMFTDALNRSARSQTAQVRVNSGAAVSQADLPVVTKLCVDPGDQLIATLQGWEDDGSAARGALSPDDDLLSGVTRRLGSAAALSSSPISMRVITQQSDNSAALDLEVTFQFSAGLSATCQGGVVQ